MSSLTSPPSQKRRKYSTRACVFCRNRHKKCDGGQPCLACDQRKQDCVYPEQQKKRGPKPRSSLNGAGANGTENGHTLGNCILSAVDFGRPREIVGVNNPVQEKTKRRKLSSNSEERLVAASRVLNEPSVEQINLNDSLKEIIQLIQQQPHAYPFMQPVRVTDAPDYYEIINQPMDFRTISKKINTYQYLSLPQFYNDLNLLVDNCRKYNQGTRSAYLIDWAIELQNFFLEEIRKRTTETLLWYPPMMDPVEQLESYRGGEVEINDLYEIDPGYTEEYDASFLTTPLETWSIFGYYDFLEPYSEPETLMSFPVYGENQNCK